MRSVHIGLLMGCIFVSLCSGASACVMDATFLRESDDETIMSCLENDDGEAFLWARDVNHATLLHLAVEAERSPELLDEIQWAAGEEWPALRDRVDRKERTALHIAAEKGSSLDIIRWLLAWGSDANAMYGVESGFLEDHGTTPLHLAVQRKDGADVVSVLLAGGADPWIERPVTVQDGIDHWPAILDASRHAEDTRVLTALLAGGANMDESSAKGENALHVAAAWDRPESVIVFLINAGVRTDQRRSEDRQTPLHLAARFSSRPETVFHLIETTDDPCVKDARERTPQDLLQVNPALSDNSELDLWFHEICVEGV